MRRAKNHKRFLLEVSFFLGAAPTPALIAVPRADPTMATADWPQEVAVALIKGAHVLFEDWLGEPLAKSEALWRSVLPTAAIDGLDHFLATVHQSVHAQSLPLMNPYHVATIIVIYLLIVFVGLALPLPAFDLKLVRILHNATLVVLSGYMMFEVLRQAYLNGYSLWGNPQDESPKGLPVRHRARIRLNGWWLA